MKTFLRAKFPSLYARLSRFRRTLRRRRFQSREVTHNYAGFPLKILLADVNGQDWYDCDWGGDPPEIKELRLHRLKTGARVFEIGAHQGVMAMVLSRIVGESGQVVAVEAEPFQAGIARRNRELNAIAQLQIIESVVVDQSGPLSARKNFDHTAADRLLDWGQVGVPGITLDDLTRKFGPPDVLFVDVDGFECQVLRGARQTLDTFPDCCVEIHIETGLEAEGGSLEEVLSFFPSESWEHRMTFLDNGWQPFVAFDPLTTKPAKRFSMIAIPRR
jgi:FkbM family methyltransferase